MRQVPGLADVVEPGGRAPELIWQVDPGAAGRLGLTVDQVAQQTAAAWSGTIATELRQGDRTVPVRVRLADAERFPPEAQGRLQISGRDGRTVPLSSLARPVATPAEVSIQRENLRRFVAVTARLDANGHLSAAAAEVERRMRKLQLPVGTSFEVGGQNEAQNRSFRELLLAFGLAAALVLLVMVAQFRAFLPALLILSAAPLSLGGALLLLRLTGTELNVSAAIGLILLVGLAVKNGIVLLDYAQRLRDQGVPVRESVAQAAGVRLRPILMTTFCTLFGILPLALGLGAGAELQRPLALAVIGGLGLSTLVTLYLVPIAYARLLERRGEAEQPPGSTR
jgi:multidrug efflux pump subunit AcrB